MKPGAGARDVGFLGTFIFYFLFFIVRVFFFSSLRWPHPPPPSRQFNFIFDVGPFSRSRSTTSLPFLSSLARDCHGTGCAFVSCGCIRHPSPFQNSGSSREKRARARTRPHGTRDDVFCSGPESPKRGDTEREGEGVEGGRGPREWTDRGNVDSRWKFRPLQPSRCKYMVGG